MKRKQITINDLIEKAKLDFENFKDEIMSGSKEEIFSKASMIHDYMFFLELIENRKIDISGRLALVRLYNSKDCLKALYDLWITEELPGLSEDEDNFLKYTLKELY